MNKIISTAVTLLTALAMQARVSLPAYLSNNMVVQQQSTLTVSGHSDRGGQVRVSASWSRQAATATIGADGSFTASLPTLKAGGPFTITIDDGDQLVINNVLAGEVWFCSGQSNMEMPVEGWGKVLNYEQELAAATHPEIRLLQSMHVTALTPVNEPQYDWTGGQEGSPWSYWTAFAQEQWGQKNRFYLLRVTANGDTGPESYGSLTNGGTIVDSRNLWVLGNYSRFIRPSSRRVELTGASDLNGLMGSAYTTPDGNELVVVYVNLGPDFTGQEIAIPARSVVTVVMQLGQPAQPVAGDLNGDGMVDIDDVNLAINIVLGKASATPQSDLNGNGSTDIADVNAIVNMVLGAHS